MSATGEGDRLAELELERIALRAELRDLHRERTVLAAMLLRAAREIGEPRLRAGFLEELEALVPGSLEGLPEKLDPVALRKRCES